MTFKLQCFMLLLSSAHLPARSLSLTHSRGKIPSLSGKSSGMEPRFSVWHCILLRVCFACKLFSFFQSHRLIRFASLYFPLMFTRSTATFYLPRIVYINWQGMGVKIYNNSSTSSQLIDDEYLIHAKIFSAGTANDIPKYTIKTNKHISLSLSPSRWRAWRRAEL